MVSYLGTELESLRISDRASGKLAQIAFPSSTDDPMLTLGDLE